jgi:lipopolysaccharide transport system permease protein
VERRSDLQHRLAYFSGLVWTLVRTDFKTRYHGTIGGYCWALAKPASMFIVLQAVFSHVFTMDPDYTLNLIIGLFLWDFFMESTKTGIISLQAKSFLLTKARFPNWVVAVTACSNATITLTLFSGVVCLYLSFFHHPLSFSSIFLFLLYLSCFLLIVIGFSLASSVLFLRYRDLNQIWELTLQAGFFIAPVIWPLDIIPERLHFYLYLWLPTPVIEFSRSVLIDQTVPSARAHLMLLSATAAVMAVGVMVYRLLAPRVIEEM